MTRSTPLLHSMRRLGRADDASRCRGTLRRGRPGVPGLAVFLRTAAGFPLHRPRLPACRRPLATDRRRLRDLSPLPRPRFELAPAARGRVSAVRAYASSERGPSCGSVCARGAHGPPERLSAANVARTAGWARADRRVEAPAGGLRQAIPCTRSTRANLLKPPSSQRRPTARPRHRPRCCAAIAYCVCAVTWRRRSSRSARLLKTMPPEQSPSTLGPAADRGLLPYYTRSSKLAKGFPWAPTRRLEPRGLHVERGRPATVQAPLLRRTARLLCSTSNRPTLLRWSPTPARRATPSVGADPPPPGRGACVIVVPPRGARDAAASRPAPPPLAPGHDLRCSRAIARVSPPSTVCSDDLFLALRTEGLDSPRRAAAWPPERAPMRAAARPERFVDLPGASARPSARWPSGSSGPTSRGLGTLKTGR